MLESKHRRGGPTALTTAVRNCFAKGLEAAFLALLEPFQWAALASLRSMMRLMAQWIIATPVSGSRS